MVIYLIGGSCCAPQRVQICSMIDVLNDNLVQSYGPARQLR